MTIDFDTSVFTQMLDNFAKTISHEVVTITKDPITGEDSTSYASGVDITGPFYRQEDAYSQKIEGLFRGADAIFLAPTTLAIKRKDKLIYDNEVYIVLSVVMRRLGETEFYQTVRLTRDESNIFYTYTPTTEGILHNPDSFLDTDNAFDGNVETYSILADLSTGSTIKYLGKTFTEISVKNVTVTASISTNTYSGAYTITLQTYNGSTWVDNQVLKTTIDSIVQITDETFIIDASIQGLRLKFEYTASGITKPHVLVVASLSWVAKVVNYKYE